MLKTHVPIKERLDEDLLPAEAKKIKALFPEYLVDHDIDPTTRSLDPPLVTGLIQMMIPFFPDWGDLDPVSTMWERDAMDSLRIACRSLKKDNCQKLLEQINKIRAEKNAAMVNGSDTIIEQEDNKSLIGDRTSKRLENKRAKKPLDPLPDQQSSIKLDDPDTAKDQSNTAQIMKSIQAPNFSDDQANIIGRELEIQDLIQKMTKNKREFKAWFKRY